MGTRGRWELLAPLPLQQRGGRFILILQLLLCQMLVIWALTTFSQPSYATAPPAASSIELSYHTTTVSIHHLTHAESESDSTGQTTHDQQHWLRWRKPASFNQSTDVRFTFYVDWLDQNQNQQSGSGRSRSQICEIALSTTSGIETTHHMKDGEDAWLECEISDLPRETHLTFVLTMIVSVDAAEAPLISPYLHLSLPPSNGKLEEPTAAPVLMHLMSFTSNQTNNITTIDRIVNDTEVRQDFVLFQNLTTKLDWSAAPNWGRDDLSICDWAPNMVACTPDRTRITELDILPVAWQPGWDVSPSAELSYIFQHLNSLASFRSGYVPFLTLDLSEQLNLTSLSLFSQAAICTSAQPSSITPIYLPPAPSLLTLLHLDHTCFAIADVTKQSFPYLQEVSVSNTPIPFPISVIAETMPALMHLWAENGLESHTPDREGRSGSALTNYWLENLNTFHPVLTILEMSGDSSSRLEFDSTFPILHSDTLDTFSFRENSQAYPSTMTNDTLKYLPQLMYLTFSHLTNMVIPLTIFEHTRSTILFHIDLSRTTVVGSLESLKPLANLGILKMSQTRLTGELPQVLADYWPHLVQFYADSNSLVGPVPSFADLPSLDRIDLQSNFFTSLPVNFLNNSITHLFSIDLSYNHIASPLFTLYGYVASELFIINIGYNNFMGELSTLITEQAVTQLPSLLQLWVNNNRLTGTIPHSIWSLPSRAIPSPSVPITWSTIALDNNPELSGPFPQNLTATKFTLSYTSLSGPVSLASFAEAPTQLLNLAFTQLSCPLDLSAATGLIELDIQSAGFSGCDVNNQTEMNVHWDVLQILDLSDNSFRPFIFTLHLPLTVLQARGCGLTSLALADYHALLNLESLVVDNNVFNLNDYTTAQFQRVFLNTLSLTLMSFQNCSLQGSIQEFVTIRFSSMSKLTKLLLGDNDFIGEIPFFLFVSGVDQSLPTSIEELDLSNNVRLTGNLPPTSMGYNALQIVDFSDTGVTGPLPESWSSFVNLNRLSLDHTQLICSSQGTCPLPSWLTPSTLTSPSTSIIGAHCPQLLIRSSTLTVVSIDEQYYHYSLCTCDEKYFGTGSTCQQCPNGCSCVGQQIQNCFPIVTASSTPTTSSGSVISIPFIISCPLTVTGESLCNPNNIKWNFNESPSGTNGGSDSSSADLTPFCYTGHTGRGCTKCMDGYFSSGRWCLQCGSNGLHIFIIIINLFLLVLLIGIIYLQLPAPMTARIQIENYFSVADSTLPLPSFHPSPAHPTSTIQTVQQNTTRSMNSPLKLLIFHSQQLGLILQTATSQPQVITGFFSIVSSGSTGFSLSSLISIECLNHSWSIQQQVWMSLLAPTLIGLVCILIYLYQRYRHGHAVSFGSAPSSTIVPSNTESDSIHLGPSDSSVTDSSSSINVTITNDSITHLDNNNHDLGIVLNFPRVYGVCLALLYFFLFPCAQTVLSALACTDTRQYDSSTSDPTSSLYLNLLPWIACDSTWRSRILPPAIVGVILWIITFPIMTTILTRYLIVRIRVSKDIQLWPLCADLFTRFKQKYWYYEQILLARRLSLVLAITIIPADSLYLPVTLFSIIQLSALIQHLMEPFQSVWLNRGELVSLYLLLLNYITALILHESTVGTGGNSGGHSLDMWSVILFLANLLFVFILIGGLFLGFQSKLLQIVNGILKLFNQPTGNSNSKSSVSSEMNQIVYESDEVDAGMIELNLSYSPSNHQLHSPHMDMNGTARSDDSSVASHPFVLSSIAPTKSLPLHPLTNSIGGGLLSESKDPTDSADATNGMVAHDHDLGLISTSI